MRAQLDEDVLKKIADMTRARYFHATSADDLKAVDNVLSRQLVVETREMEITDILCHCGALCTLVAVSLSPPGIIVSPEALVEILWPSAQPKTTKIPPTSYFFQRCQSVTPKMHCIGGVARRHLTPLVSK